MIIWPTLSASETARLERSGITQEEFEFFPDHFVGDRWDYVVRSPSNNYTRMFRRRPLMPHELLRHLEGRAWYFTGCLAYRKPYRLRTKSFLIDLDAKDKARQSTLWTRYERCVAIFGEPTWLFQSSASGGLHLVYWLDTECSLMELAHPNRKDGVVLELLALHGLSEEDGVIEVYPRGSIQKKVHRRIRIPFGLDSRLLDPAGSHEPLTNGPLEDLKEAFRRFTNGSVRLYSLEQLRAQAQVDRQARPSVSISQPRPKRTSKRSSKRTATWHGVDVRSLDEHGLQRGGQFNSAVFAKSLQFRSEGMPLQEAEVRLQVWIDEHHNGQSNTYNRSPKAAHAKAIQDLRWVYAHGHAGKSYWAELPGLSPSEVRRIQWLTRHDSALADSTTGEMFPRLKVQNFMFQCLNGAKQWVVTQSNRLKRDVSALHPTLPEESAEYQELLAKRMQHIRPDPTSRAYHVQLPYSFRVGLKGVSERSANALWRIVLRTGLFRQVRRASAQANRAASYRVVLDLDSNERCQSLGYGVVEWSPPRRDGEYQKHELTRMRNEAIKELTTKLPGKSVIEARAHVKRRSVRRKIRKALKSIRQERSRADGVGSSHTECVFSDGVTTASHVASTAQN